MSRFNRPAFALRVFLAGLVWLAAASVAHGAAAPESARAPWQKYTHGLLWRIETAGAPPSYLFGTLHSDDPRVTDLPAPVKTAFDGARSFTMELIADAGALAAITKLMFFDDGRTLPALLGDALYAETQRVLKQEGLPHQGIERQKPWAVVMMLSAPRPRTGVFLDLLLQAQAGAQAKPTYGLETVDEQLAAFNDLPMADQVTLLKETLRLQAHARAELEELTRAYVARDLGRIMAVAERNRPADARVHDALMTQLITQRNHRMVERLRTRLAEGNGFIAVGAAHLPGADGMLYLLERNGYRVSRVY